MSFLIRLPYIWQSVLFGGKMKTPIIDLAGMANTLNKINNAYSSVGSVIDSTLKDMISRAPGKIASSVTSIYGIKKSEIKYTKNFKKKSAGNISIHGESLSSLEFRYAGRVLTPLHFSMTPKSKPGSKKYKIKAKIKKKQVLLKPKDKEGAIFLNPAQKGSSTMIPWMRGPSQKYDPSPFKTLSLPQMVDNKDVRENIRKELDDLLEKRYEHHLSRHFKRCL